MTATTMTIQDDEWTIVGMWELWAEDGDPRASEYADTQYAWIINHVHEYLPYSWSYNNDGSFSGPPLTDAYPAILNIITESIDFVVACIQAGEFEDDAA